MILHPHAQHSGEPLRYFRWHFHLTEKAKNLRFHLCLGHRSAEEIEQATERFYDWVVWDRQQQEKLRMQIAGETVPDDPEKWEMAEDEAARIEKKYGREMMGWSSTGISDVEARLSTLFWLTGKDWNFISEIPNGDSFYRPNPEKFAATIQRSVLGAVNAKSKETLRAKLEFLAFGILVDIDHDENGSDRIQEVEDLHEVYTMYVQRGGKSIQECIDEQTPAKVD